MTLVIPYCVIKSKIRFIYGVTDGKNGKLEKVDVDSLDLQYGWIYYKKGKKYN